MKLSHRVLAGLCAVLMLASLSACSVNSASQPENIQWMRILSNMFENNNNYIIHLQTTEDGVTAPISDWKGSFDGQNVMVQSTEDGTEQKMLYVKKESGCEAYVYNADYQIWLFGAEIAYDDNIFYPNSIIDRLKKYGGLIDAQKMVLQNDNWLFDNADEPMNYVAMTEPHSMRYLSVKTDGKTVRYVKEIYTITIDGTEHLRTDEIWFHSVGETVLEMPEKVWTQAEIEEYQKNNKTTTPQFLLPKE